MNTTHIATRADGKKGNALVLFIIVLLIIIAGYLLVRTINRNTVREIVTYTGIQVCLPHKDTSGVTTLECAFGIQTDDGSYYALDTSELTTATFFNTGDRIDVTGSFTPYEEMEEQLKKYNVKGSILVSSLSLSVENPTTTNSTTIDNLTFSRPEDFGLALTQTQILQTGTIPPCSEGFDYCLYYNADTYENTNFEVAGVAITKRSDLLTREACLETQPEGYQDLPFETRTDTQYAASVFKDIGGAGAGHYAQGDIYRISYGENNDMCYEFETRIGEAQFANYPAGTIEEFTEADRAVVHNKLESIVRSVRLFGQPVMFPEL